MHSFGSAGKKDDAWCSFLRAKVHKVLTLILDRSLLGRARLLVRFEVFSSSSAGLGRPDRVAPGRGANLSGSDPISQGGGHSAVGHRSFLSNRDGAPELACTTLVDKIAATKRFT